MDTRTSLAVLAVFLMVLTGCSALSGSGTVDRTETVTPIPVTTATEGTPTLQDDLPAGVYANGTIDVRQLIAAHRSSVAGHTYTWEFRQDVAREGSGSVDNVFTQRVTVGPTAYLFEQTSMGLFQNRSLYAEDVGYHKTESDNETRFDQRTEPRDAQSYVFAGEVLRTYLVDVNLGVSVARDTDQTYYRLHSGDGTVPRPLDRSGMRVRDYRVTAFVTSEGLVRTVAVQYRRVGPGPNRSVSIRYEYTDIGSTTVTEPDWVSRVTPTPHPETQSAARTPTTFRTDRSPPEPAGTEHSENETATQGVVSRKLADPRYCHQYCRT